MTGTNCRDVSVDVWHIGLDHPPGDVDTLAPDERSRADRFWLPQHRSRFVARRAVLRQILASYTGLNPADVCYAVGPHGKPYLTAPQASPDVRFSLSHSGPHALVAVAEGREVGIDIERVQTWPDCARLLAMVCAPAEQRSFADTDAGQFSQIWTAKEALLKATGTGLSVSPAYVEVWADEALVPSWNSRDGRAWCLTPLSAPDGLRASLATDGQARVFYREWA